MLAKSMALQHALRKTSCLPTPHLLSSKPSKSASTITSATHATLSAHRHSSPSTKTLQLSFRTHGCNFHTLRQNQTQRASKTGQGSPVASICHATALGTCTLQRADCHKQNVTGVTLPTQRATPTFNPLGPHGGMGRRDEKESQGHDRALTITLTAVRNRLMAAR